jgi:hypothetical protein
MQSLIQNDQINNALKTMELMVMKAAVKMRQPGERGRYNSLV